MEELKDIKGFVEVPDSSFLYFMLTLGGLMALLIGLVLLYLWFRKPKRRARRLSAKELAKRALKSIDFNDTKESVYLFSENIQIVEPENQELDDFLKQLEIYKFKREVPTLAEEDKSKMQRYIKELTHE